jgi:hypothetical protein
MRILVPAVLLMTLVNVNAFADNSFSLTGQCAKSDPQHALPVPDSPGHVLIVAKSHCTLSGGEVNGLALKQQDVYGTTELNGVNMTEHGYVIVTAEGGDKAFVTYQGKGTVHDKTGDGDGTWKFTGGTGKLKGLEGKGTYKTAAKADGTATDQIDGGWNIHESAGSKIRSVINKAKGPK